VTFNEKFVTGRLRRRVLRSPIIDGWQCDEHNNRPPQRVKLELVKLGGDALGLRIPGQQDLAKLSAEATQLIADGQDWEVTIGWPEALVVIRRDGVVVYAEGDPMHFGELALDTEHSLRRSGYEYVDEHSPEVKVELAMDHGDQVETVLLGPAERAQHGPYSIFHERSFDPSDRRSSLRHHGYFVRVRRNADAPAPPPRDTGAPSTSPLDVDNAAQVVDLARRARKLDADEAMLTETAELARRIKLYEGGPAQLEQAVRACGPDPATFVRRGDAVAVETARVARGQRGQTLIGRATIVLLPTGAMRISRIDVDSLPGRMRRATQTGA